MENYNDFLLPHNETFKIINNEYINTRNKNNNISNLHKLIKETINLCFHLDIKLNSKIRQAVDTTKKELEKIEENLALTFNINNQITNQTVYKTNIFSFLKKLISIIDSIKSILQSTEKIYHKRILISSMSIAINSTNNVLSALESSTISTYRYI